MYITANVLRVARETGAAKCPRRQPRKGPIIEIESKGEDKVSNIVLNSLEVE